MSALWSASEQGAGSGQRRVRRLLNWPIVGNRVDPARALPVYEQVREQITRMVVAGTLRVGTQLPTIRQLAADLGLAKGTVARAYELLESDAVIESKGRKGTFVLERPASEPGAQHLSLDTAAETLVVIARQLGVTERQTVEALRRSWRSL